LFLIHKELRSDTSKIIKYRPSNVLWMCFNGQKMKTEPVTFGTLGARHRLR
jgi:hypothetical protein